MYLFDCRKNKSESRSYSDGGTGSDNSVKNPNYCDENVADVNVLVPYDEDVVAGHESAIISKGYGK